MRQVFTSGQGGKHGRGDDARYWRWLHAHVAANIRAAYPQMHRRLVHEHATVETASVIHALNRRERLAMLDAIAR